MHVLAFVKMFVAMKKNLLLPLTVCSACVNEEQVNYLFIFIFLFLRSHLKHFKGVALASTASSAGFF